MVSFTVYRSPRVRAGISTCASESKTTIEMKSVSGSWFMKVSTADFPRVSLSAAAIEPLLSLVIDKSGSMAAADKLTRGKSAVLTFINQLPETDFISIVVFDSEAQVLMPARTLGDRYTVKDTIRSIEPGSSTNLHAGLMLGYHEALKNYRKDITNRVILLTEAIANQGVTDPGQIAHDSISFNDAGIDLSTIGVGLVSDAVGQQNDAIGDVF